METESIIIILKFVVIVGFNYASWQAITALREVMVYYKWI